MNEFPVNDIETLHAIFDPLRNGIILTDQSSNIVYVNNAYVEITGYSFDEIIGNNPGMMRSGYQSADFYKDMWLEINNTGAWTGVVWNRNKASIVYPIYLTISKIITKTDSHTYYLGIFSDISMLEMDKKHQLNLHTIDFLTELPNKADFTANFNKIIKESIKGQQKRFAVIVININEFQIINDQYGFVFGDNLLHEIAQRAKKLDLKTEVFARISGDKFALLIPMIKQETDIEKYTQIIEGIFSKSFVIDDIEVFVTCRTAAAIIPDSNLSFDEIISQTD